MAANTPVGEGGGGGGGGGDPVVLVVSSHAHIDQFEAALVNTREVGFDLEGVDLGRFGTISIASVTVGMTCFLIDLYSSPDAAFRDRQLTVLRGLAESDSVCKVVHDVRQDSDALHAHLGITLRNVFDTSVAHMCVTNASTRSNLNAVLTYFGMQINSARVNVDYKTYPRYWEKRPLTATMIDHASGDTLQLLGLRERILFHVFGHRVSKEPESTPEAMQKIESLMERLSLSSSSSTDNLASLEAASKTSPSSSPPPSADASSSSSPSTSSSVSSSSSSSTSDSLTSSALSPPSTHSGSASPDLSQLDFANSSNPDVQTVRLILRQSSEAVDHLRRMQHGRTVRVNQGRMGAVIGKQGCNVHHIERVTGAAVSKCMGGFFVMATSEQAVKDAIDIIKGLERNGRIYYR